ncbi:MAG: DUF4058 family protein [Chloroflexi bacterium]|nr:DUF4058 family protein [Chloroflexota bacterium]
MPIQSVVNQYLGVNAHLQSYYQARGGWEGFHNKHIADLGEAINALLPEGYIVDMEQSLQIREERLDTGETAAIRLKADVTIYQTSRTNLPPNLPRSAATLERPLLETLDGWDEDVYYPALIVYQVEENIGGLGKPVTRIELLSPTNKTGEAGRQYRDKRRAVVRSGLQLVEIDYQHETPSPVKDILLYPQQPGSYPYSITISRPRPSIETGTSRTYAFYVDDPVPTIPIPLAENDEITVPLNTVYNRTYSSLRAYSFRVDYERLPERFERYSEFDQQRIHTRMALVADLYRQGVRLEDGPFPIPQEYTPDQK